MGYNDSDTTGCLIYLIIGGFYGIVTFVSEGFYKDPLCGYIFGAIAIIFSIRAYYKNNQLAEQNEISKRNQKITERECNRKIFDIRDEYKKKEAEIKRKEEICRRAINESAPFTYSATLQADMRTAVFDDIAQYMIEKPYPAKSKAETVKELKAKTRVAIKECKESKYKLEYLLQVFPEIRRYIDEEEALLNLASFSTYDDFTDNIDHSQDYLSKEEYENLSTVERNQRALDKWKKSDKSNWTIGMLYEMYIGHLLKNSSYEVIQFGIVNHVCPLKMWTLLKKFNNQIKLVH